MLDRLSQRKKTKEVYYKIGGKRFVSMDEAGEYFKVSPNTIHRWLKEKKLVNGYQSNKLIKIIQ